MTEPSIDPTEARWVDPEAENEVAEMVAQWLKADNREEVIAVCKQATDSDRFAIFLDGYRDRKVEVVRVAVVHRDVLPQREGADQHEVTLRPRLPHGPKCCGLSCGQTDHVSHALRSISAATSVRGSGSVTSSA